MSVRHARAKIGHILEVFCKVTITGGVAALTSATGELQETADISFTNTGTGVYVVTINPFKMPRGEAYALLTGFIAAGTAQYSEIKSIAYTGDSLAITCLFFAGSGDGATDPDGFFLHVVAQ